MTGTLNIREIQQLVDAMGATLDIVRRLAPEAWSGLSHSGPSAAWMAGQSWTPGWAWRGQGWDGSGAGWGGGSAGGWGGGMAHSAWGPGSAAWTAASGANPLVAQENAWRGQPGAWTPMGFMPSRSW